MSHVRAGRDSPFGLCAGPRQGNDHAVFHIRLTRRWAFPSVVRVTTSGVRGWAMLVAAAGLLAPSAAYAVGFGHAEGASLPPVRMSKIQFDPPGADDATTS